MGLRLGAAAAFLSGVILLGVINPDFGPEDDPLVTIGGFAIPLIVGFAIGGHRPRLDSSESRNPSKYHARPRRFGQSLPIRLMIRAGAARSRPSRERESGVGRSLTSRCRCD